MVLFCVVLLPRVAKVSTVFVTVASIFTWISAMFFSDENTALL